MPVVPGIPYISRAKDYSLFVMKVNLGGGTNPEDILDGPNIISPSFI
jgi:hypothetical protein